MQHINSNILSSQLVVSPSGVISGVLCIIQFKSRLRRAVFRDKNLVRIHAEYFYLNLCKYLDWKQFDLFINNFFRFQTITTKLCNRITLVGVYIMLLKDFLLQLVQNVKIETQIKSVTMCMWLMRSYHIWNASAAVIINSFVTVL